MDLTKTTGYVPGFPAELNLRELGGLPTVDGRRVRRGLFYRGSTLAGLSDAERARVDNLGLRQLLDLRTRGEASEAEDYVPAGCTYERVAGMYFEDGTEVDFSPSAIEEWESMDLPGMDDGTFMLRLYIGMAFGNPSLQALATHVRAGELPIYFHCSAGKDRTGVNALLLGLILGVTREGIFEDYLLTNEHRRSIIEDAINQLGPDADPEEVERWEMANGVQAETLQVTLDAIEERYGTTDAYLEAEFGLDAATLAELRDRYLEEPAAEK